VTPRVALTGANGFVGGLIADALGDVLVLRLVRRPAAPLDVPWSFAMTAEQVAAGLAGRGLTHLIHAAWDMQARNRAEMQACVAGSAALFAGARQAGIGTVVFIYSISAFAGARAAYGRAKLAVEQGLAESDMALRLGLVWGAGGMAGRLRAQLATARLLPLIGDGWAPQYLLGADSLKQAIRLAVAGAWPPGVVTLAHPAPVPFRQLLRACAAAQCRRVVLIPTPWRVLHAGLVLAEAGGMRLAFRSDAVLSYIYQNPAPDVSAMARAGFAPAPVEID
jgi:nucleoside-diphosphate-sugar epimerase